MHVKCCSAVPNAIDYLYLKLKYHAIDDCFHCIGIDIVMYDNYSTPCCYSNEDYKDLIGIPLLPLDNTPSRFLVILKTNEVLVFPETLDNFYLQKFIDNTALARSVTNFKDFKTLANL